MVAAGAVATSLPACRAQVKAKANVNAAEAEVDADRKWEIAEPAQETPPAAAPQAAPRVASAVAPPPAVAPALGGVFLGVTHDLSLSAGTARTPACRCLAVAYGHPSDGKFTWQAGTPSGDHDTVAIAIAADGVACTNGAPPLRASIAAVEREGSDIVLVVENVGVGRPIMRGALAAYPGPNSAIVVRTNHGTPYPAASGAGECRIPLR